MINLLPFNHGEDIVFGHDKVFLAVNLDFSARVAGEENTVVLLELHGGTGAVISDPAGADFDDFAFLRFFLGAVGKYDAALGDFFSLKAFDQDLFAQLFNCHNVVSS